MQQKVPFSLIRCCSSKVAFCSCVEWGWHIYNIVESESDPLTRRPVDLFEKEPLKGNSEVHLHTPTKFGEDRSKDLGGDREQTDRQTNRQTDKRCSIYSMILLSLQTTIHMSVQLPIINTSRCLRLHISLTKDKTKKCFPWSKTIPDFRKFTRLWEVSSEPGIVLSSNLQTNSAKFIGLKPAF